MFINNPDSHYPVIVIGSGPAGMTVASTLINEHGFDRVLLVESGGLDYDPEINQLSLVNASGDLSDEYYATHSIRAFGGTSMVWAGWCSMLESLSFRLGEWPFSHESLKPYYQRAAPILELPTDSVEQYELPIRKGSSINYRPFYLSPPVRFGAKFRDFSSESSALSVLLETTVRRIDHDDGVVTGVTIGASDESATAITAEKVVLACGGVGNPRLLLLSGLDANGQVGKNFMEHPHVYSYNKVALKGDAVNRTHSVSGRRMNAFSLSEQTLVDAGVRSFTMSTGPQEDAGLEPNTAQNTVAALITVQAEMRPREDNRLTLGKDIDGLGQPKAEIEFQFRVNDIIPEIWRLTGERFLRENLGRFAAPGPVTEVTGGGHLMGTTRMGAKGKGCVNEHGEVHGCRSLFVAGSSVFPAGGAANPTFTIVALAIRLADHLAGLKK